MLLLLAVWVVGDDASNREPVTTAAAGLTLLFAFAAVWRFYAVPGALLTLGASIVAVFAPAFGPFWRRYPVVGWRGVAMLGGIVALDDAAQHTIGLLTPGEWVWQVVIQPLVTAT